jgi:hypothetical protein
MNLEGEDIKRAIQWFNAVEDLNPAYLTPEDRALAESLKQSHAAETPQVVNPKAPGDLKVGDYVFASRWSDCDPGDPWYVGHVAEIHLAEPGHAVPYPGYVVLRETARRWPHAMRITQEQGARIVKELPAMERQRPVNFAAVARVFGLARKE